MENPSYYRRAGAEPLLAETIPAHFTRIAREHGAREAAVSLPQRRRLTYAQFATAVDRLARGLLGAGFRTGDRVGVWSTNNLEWQLLQMATARIGAVLVNVNPAYRPRELAYALARAEVQGLFTIPSFRTSDYVAMLLELLPELAGDAPEALRCRELPQLRRVVLYDPADPGATARPARGFTLWGEIDEAADAVPAGELEHVLATIGPHDPVNIQFTSGTTGFPKAVVLTHANILNNAWTTANAMRFGPGDRLCIPVPFYHCFGMVLANLLCFSVGATAVIPSEHFDPLAVLAGIAAERCTAVHGVPTMFIAMLDHPRFAEFDLTSLRTGIMAGAPCPPELLRRVMGVMHCPEILVGYGETEASPLTHLTAPDDSLERRTLTVGRSLPHQEARVVDPATGAVVPLGAIGEICFRGYNVMRGYYRDEAATAAAIDPEGWLHSGDLGTMDAEGYVSITGRLKEMIIRGGENIYPREIEDVLFTHPRVALAAVFGIPDPFYGEEVVAWVRLRAGAAADEEGIRAFCRERLAHFKVPRRIWFVEEFPMTVTGKVRKFRMPDITLGWLACKERSES